MLDTLLQVNSIISITYGVWSAILLLASVPILFELNVFKDPTLQPNVSGMFGIVEMSIGVVAAVIGAVQLISVYQCKIKQKSGTQWITGTIFSVFCIAQIIFVIFRIQTRDRICSDTSFTGCPVARYELQYTVDSEEDCIFNAYDLDNINNLEINGGTTLIDWSDKKFYDHANVNLLVDAANSNSGNSSGLDIDAAAMPLLHDCYYWGCGKVCNPRERMNRMLIFNSIIASVCYLTLAILSYTLASKLSSSESLDVRRGRASREPSEENDEEGVALLSGRSARLNFRM